VLLQNLAHRKQNRFDYDKSHNDKSFPEVEPGAGFYRATSMVNAEENLPAAFKLGPDMRMENDPAETPLTESGSWRPGGAILKGAVILGSLLGRLVASAFYLEISLLESLKRPQEDRHFRRHEAESSWGNAVSYWDWAI